MTERAAEVVATALAKNRASELRALAATVFAASHRRSYAEKCTAVVMSELPGLLDELDELRKQVADLQTVPSGPDGKTFLESHCAGCARCQAYRRMADDEARRHGERAAELQRELDRRGACPAAGGVVLPGWCCPALACRAFNGEAKHVLEVCRCCGAARPEAVTPTQSGSGSGSGSGPRLVILESPYAANPVTLATVGEHEEYGRRCLRDSLLRGEAPLASHLLYTQSINGWEEDGAVLDDSKPAERAIGIEAGLAWGLLAEATVAYVDMGVSGGMLLGLERARAEHRPVEFRTLVDGCPAIEVARIASSPAAWAKLEAGGWL